MCQLTELTFVRWRETSSMWIPWIIKKKKAQSANSRLKCSSEQQNIVRIWCLGSDLITPCRYVSTEILGSKTS